MTTLATMLTLLRQRTNMEVSQFVTDAELTSYLNNSLCLLDGLLISKFNDYKLSSTTLSIVSNTDYLLLPTDFLKMRGLDVIVSNTEYCAISEFQFKSRNSRFTVSSPEYIEYRLQSNRIILQPPEMAVQYTYRLWYTPDYIPLVNSSDSLQPYMDSQAWYEFAIVNSAVKVLAKQNMDPSTFIQQAAELKNHIEKLSAPNRNAGEPIAVQDSRGNSNEWYW